MDIRIGVGRNSYKGNYSSWFETKIGSNGLEKKIASKQKTLERGIGLEFVGVDIK
jgi:hypothetical protein